MAITSDKTLHPQSTRPSHNIEAEIQEMLSITDLPRDELRHHMVANAAALQIKPESGRAFEVQENKTAFLALRWAVQVLGAKVAKETLRQIERRAYTAPEHR